MDREKLVDGVSLRIVEHTLSRLARKQLKRWEWELKTDKTSVALVVPFPDRPTVELTYLIDETLIPGHPYWWWQLYKGDKPVDFGKASMSSYYKATLAEHVALLWREL